MARDPQNIKPVGGAVGGTGAGAEPLDRGQQAAARAMEMLAASERASAPAGLEDRVFAASAPLLRAGATEIVRHEAGHGRRGWTPGRAGVGQRRRWMVIAAGLGAIACLTTAWLALRGAAPSVPGAGDNVLADGSDRAAPIAPEVAVVDVDVEVDALFAASSILGSDWDQEITSLRIEAASLGLDLADPSSAGMGGGLTETSWMGGAL